MQGRGRYHEVTAPFVGAQGYIANVWAGPQAHEGVTRRKKSW